MDERKITRNEVLKNMIWRFAERVGAQVVSFAVTLVIARILGPQAYGTVAVITVFTTVLFVFVDSGLGNALIQKKDADNIDFSTVFYTNIILCIILYLGLYFCAPLIALFYSNPEMVALVRVSGLMLPISGIKNIQQAYVAKNMLFKKFFHASLGGTLGAALIGIGMALSGFGVWALIISGLFNNAIDTIILWFSVKWRPQKVFSFKRLKGLFVFGSRILAANIFQSIYSNMYQLIIGKMYSSADLAYYDRGKVIADLVVTNVDDSINSVLLPVMSKSQDDKSEIRIMSKKALKINMYVMAPALIGIAAISEPLILLLLTEKWIGAVVYLEIFCVIQVMRPISTANLSAMKAVGRSDLFFKLEIWKEVVGITILLITMQYGVLGIAMGVFITSLICHAINAWPSKKLINYSLWEQITDILPILFLVGIMFSVVYPIKYFQMSNILTIIIQVIVGIMVYVSGSYLLKIDSFFYMFNLIREWIGKKER